MQRDLAVNLGICIGLGPIQDLEVACPTPPPKFGINRMNKFIKLDGEDGCGGNDIAGEEVKSCTLYGRNQARQANQGNGKAGEALLPKLVLEPQKLSRGWR